MMSHRMERSKILDSLRVAFAALATLAVLAVTGIVGLLVARSTSPSDPIPAAAVDSKELQALRSLLDRAQELGRAPTLPCWVLSRRSRSRAFA